MARRLEVTRCRASTWGRGNPQANKPQSAATLRKRTASACSLAANSRARSACCLAWAASDPPCSAMPSCTRATSSSTSATASANLATCARSVWLCARVCSTRASRSGLLGSGSAIEEPEYPPTREVYPPPRTTPWLLHPSHHPCWARPIRSLVADASGAPGPPRPDRTLGPCWVRSARGPQRHERSLPVTNGKEERLVDEPSAQAARTTPGSGSDCGPEGQARCVGQQTGSNRPP
jgi:hypothetical protein